MEIVSYSITFFVSFLILGSFLIASIFTLVMKNLEEGEQDRYLNVYDLMVTLFLIISLVGTVGNSDGRIVEIGTLRYVEGIGIFVFSSLMFISSLILYSPRYFLYEDLTIYLILIQLFFVYLSFNIFQPFWALIVSSLGIYIFYRYRLRKEMYLLKSYEKDNFSSGEENIFVDAIEAGGGEVKNIKIPGDDKGLSRAREMGIDARAWNRTKELESFQIERDPLLVNFLLIDFNCKDKYFEQVFANINQVGDGTEIIKRMPLKFWWKIFAANFGNKIDKL